MAATYTIEVKTKCKSYKTPSLLGATARNENPGTKYYITAQPVSGDQGKKFYKISGKQYILVSNCNLLSKSTNTDTTSSSTSTTTGTTTDTTTDTSSSTTQEPAIVWDPNTPLNLETATQDELIAAIDADVKQIITNKTTTLESGIDGSVRMFGLPHQLTEYTDYRLSKTTKLGVMFTETFVSNAPIIYIKPGGSNFLPGMTDVQKQSFIKGLVDVGKGTKHTIMKEFETMTDDDYRYFDFTTKYPEYMLDVNMLCRIGAVFFGLNSTKVPWVDNKNVNFGNYNWAKYNFTSRFNNAKMTINKEYSKVKDQDIISLAKNIFTESLTDDEWVQFYVDANASFSESASNNTTNSMISDFTEQVQGIGKELAFVSGITGTDGFNLDDLVNMSTSSIDSVVNSLARGDGAISSFLRRFTGVGKQILAGGNFLTPEIWGSSSYSKNYSFSISLSTPYGDVRAWYLNVYVPLMHILALALPLQMTANVYMAPRLVRVFSQGWFSCDLGIIDSISIEKGGSGDAWTIGGLPNEIRVSLSVKDLYSNLALPSGYNLKAFFSNTSLINYLMVNCGIDISKRSMEYKLKVMITIVMNTLSDSVQVAADRQYSKFKEFAQNIFNL